MTIAAKTTAALLTAAFLAACAGGTPTNQGTLDVLAQVDRNADGGDLEEWMAHGDRTFTKLDVGGDGNVTVKDVEEGFDAFDVDGDGVLSQSEVDSPELDANKDGQITRDEWDGAKVHARMDTNGDGRVTRSEARTYSARGHRSWDRDGDGRVSRSEAAVDQFTLWRF